MSMFRRKEAQARTIWTGNGFGIEFVVHDPFTIYIFLLLEKDPTLTDNEKRTIASTIFYREGTCDDSGEVVPGTEEPMRGFAERVHQEALEWAASEIADYKLTEELDTIMGEVLDSSSE